MDIEDKIKDIIFGVGSIAEMNWVFYTASIASGFTKAQAVILTKSFMETILGNMKPTPPEAN